jgi:peptidoglycan/xylan/chitin deacetylase (PgdA/CDA1 family)
VRRNLDWLRRRRPQPAILMYHRVAEPLCDPWTLAVPPAEFERQMADLRAHRLPLSLVDFVARLRAGTLPAKAVALTFDDGYLDNLVNARPVLERHGIPATLFVATGFVGSREPFWWDELAAMMLTGPATPAQPITFGDRTIEVILPALDGTAAATEARQAGHLEVWRVLRDCTEAERRDALGRLRALLGAPALDPLCRPMTAAEVGQWLSGGLTGIGAHTVTHPALRELAPPARRAEIEDSLARCRDLAGGGIEAFACPYGDRDVDVDAAVAAAGLDWACSTRASPVRYGGEPNLFDLPRLHVRPGPILSQLPRGA